MVVKELGVPEEEVQCVLTMEVCLEFHNHRQDQTVKGCFRYIGI